MSAASRVTVAGRSWESPEQGFYCFEAAVDGNPTILHVSEHVAFDLLGAWTADHRKCLEILRSNRPHLAKMLEAKIKGRIAIPDSACHRLEWRDAHRYSARQPGTDPSHGDGPHQLSPSR